MKYNKLYKKLLVILFILAIIPISLSFSSNQVPDNVDSEFALHTSTFQETSFNFDDYIFEGSTGINGYDVYDSIVSEIRVDFNPNVGPVIIRGIEYFYDQETTSSSQIKYTIKGETGVVNYYETLPDQGSFTWHSLGFAGPTYLIDDDPQVLLQSYSYSETFIRYDSGVSGNSYYRDVPTDPWTALNNEYAMMLQYERVINMNIETCMSGCMTTTDNVDAYFIELEGDVEYQFSMILGTGTGKIGMRIVTNNELTDDTLTSATCYPSDDVNEMHVKFKPPTTSTYVLLVEAEDPFIDVNGYNMYYTEYTEGATVETVETIETDDPSDPNPPLVLKGNNNILAIGILTATSGIVIASALYRHKKKKIR